MQRRLLAPFLICALLALPGCGIVKGVAKRSLVRFLSGTVAAMLFGSDEAAAEDVEHVEEDDTTVAEGAAGDGSFFGNGEDSSDDAVGSGFYKVVEANGTVRFVSTLEEVPAAQRPNAQRIDTQPVAGAGGAKGRAPSRRAVQQLAAAKSGEPEAAP